MVRTLVMGSCLLGTILNSEGAQKFQKKLLKGETDPVISSVWPNRIRIGENTQITIRGHFLPQDAKIFIGGDRCTKLIHISPQQLECSAPLSSRTDTRDVIMKLDRENKSVTLQKGIRYILHPPPIIHRIVNQNVTAFTYPQITVTGKDFDSTTKVYVGKYPCKIQSWSSNSLTFTLSVALFPGNFDLEIRKKNCGVAKIVGGITVHDWMFPVKLENARNLKDGNDPIPLFQDFKDSEAEVLLNAYHARIGSKQHYDDWYDYVLFQGIKLDISDSGIPPVENRGYWFDSSKGKGHELIEKILDYATQSFFTYFVDRSVSGKVVLKLNESTILKLPKEIRDDVIDQIDEGHIKFVSELGVSSYYDVRSWKNEREKEYFEFLRNSLFRNIDELNKVDPRGYFVHPGHISQIPSTSTDVSLSSEVYLYQNAFDQWAMYQVLEAIRKNDEGAFLKAALEFATSFPSHNTEAKTGFLDSFTRLFVTKEFPSEGLRQAYYHFILRCGHLH